LTLWQQDLNLTKIIFSPNFEMSPNLVTLGGPCAYRNSNAGVSTFAAIHLKHCCLKHKKEKMPNACILKQVVLGHIPEKIKNRAVFLKVG
jgi:hypothetical protein